MGTSYTSHFNTVLLIADADTSNTLQLTMLLALQHRHLKRLKTYTLETPYKSDNLPFANSPGTALSTDKH